jgi:5-methylcytosine-specific restriction protein B
MNTADRSIALLDAALRRRFFFIPFFPDEPPIEGLLRRWLNQHKPELEWVADIVDQANAQLGDRNVGIGPSYFMRANLTEEWVELIWQHSIVPYLGEQFFGEEERLGDFELTRLRFGVPSSEPEDGDAVDEATQPH